MSEPENPIKSLLTTSTYTKVWAGAEPNHLRPTDVTRAHTFWFGQQKLNQLAAAWPKNRRKVDFLAKPWLSWLELLFTKQKVVGSSPIGGSEVVRPGSDRSQF